MSKTLKPSQKDLEDAIAHADTYGYSGWAIRHFNLEFLGNLSVKELSGHDDFSSWVDLDPSDFAGLSQQEKVEQLADFRGPEWAERASRWLKTGIPPIVVISTPDPEDGIEHTQIGDGRGRVNFAIAFGLKLPTWKLTYKGLQESTREHVPPKINQATIYYFQISEDDENHDEFFNQLIALGDKTGIRFSGAETPFEVAVLGDTVLGGSVISIAADELGFSVVVDPKRQGTGIGKRLIAGVLNHAREYGVASVYADVVNDTVLRPYLSKLGFKDNQGRLMRLTLQEERNMNKTELRKLIQETVASALKEYDSGDRELQQSAKADNLVQQTDQHLGDLKALAQALYKKQDPTSLQMLQAINTSLAGFVGKVTKSVRSGKIS